MSLIPVDIKIANTLEASLLVDYKQARYALALTINRLTEEIGAVVTRQEQQRFTVRAPQFILLPKILPKPWRATRDNLVGRLAFGDDSAIGRRRRAILEPFEEGGQKGGGLSGPVAIPTKALRPTKSAIVDRKMYPKYLGLVPRRDARVRGGVRAAKARKLSSGAVVAVGRNGTFVLDPRAQAGLNPKAWGVYQRFGPGKRDIKMIWAYRERVPIPDMLDLVPIAERLVPERFERTFRGFFDFAVRTAK